MANQTPHKFWNLKLTTNNSAELLLYGPISEYSWWGDEVTPKQFIDDLASLGDVEEIAVRINSGGGDVFAGVAIYNALKRHAAKIIVYIDGLAASIASIIAMAGDKIVMGAGAMMMVHNPWSSVWGGDANDFRIAADLLDKIRDSLVDVYIARTNLSRDEIITMMDAETWLGANDAVKLGFADEVENAIPVAASMRNGMAFFNGVKHDLSKFANAPKLPVEVAPVPTLNQGGMKLMTLDDLKNQHPDIYAAAVKVGVDQERARMQALDEIAQPGTQEIINKAKYETGASAADAAIEIIKAEQRNRQQYAANAQEDAKNSGVNGVGAGDATPGNGDAAELAEELANAMNRKRGGN